MWCYALRVVAVVLRSLCVVLCTLCQLVSNYVEISEDLFDLNEGNKACEEERRVENHEQVLAYRNYDS